MKKLFVVVAMMGMSLASFAQTEGNDTLKSDTDTVTTVEVTGQPASATSTEGLPQVVKDVIAKAYPDATIVGFSTENQDGQSLYAVQIKTSDQAVFTEKYDGTGKVIE